MSPGARTKGLAIWANCIRVVGDFQTRTTVSASLPSTSKTPDGCAIGGPHRRSSNGASLLFRRGATSTWVHPRSSSPVSSSSFQLQLWRLLSLALRPDRCCLQCFRGKLHFSRLSAMPSSQHSSRVVSAKTSPHCLFSFFSRRKWETFKLFCRPRSLVVAPPVNRAGETDSRTRGLWGTACFGQEAGRPGPS